MPAHCGGLGKLGQGNAPGGHAGEVAAVQSPAHPTIERALVTLRRCRLRSPFVDNEAPADGRIFGRRLGPRSAMPRKMAVLAHAHRRSTGRTEVGAVPLHARGYSFEIGNVVIAQSHHVRCACLLHLRRASILRVRTRQRRGQYRKQNPGDDSRDSRKLRIGLLDALCHRRPPLNAVCDQLESGQVGLGGR
jgi:hypothetical protein